jgi:hypothetical protein
VSSAVRVRQAHGVGGAFELERQSVLDGLKSNLRVRQRVGRLPLSLGLWAGLTQRARSSSNVTSCARMHTPPAAVALVGAYACELFKLPFFLIGVQHAGGGNGSAVCCAHD